ncbi:unnamed protein product [Porites lobata]|uniref:ADP-ribosylation factor-like protein 13B n=1 Tax=Porites lobata TaxID=104759 RepID=A0ABN8PM65_9CNID|nr:unnamed protein product [Porites lobata]
MIGLMANCFSWVKRRREPWKKVTILMVGLDNAGKTSTVADLTGETTDGITPTIGFSNSSFSLHRFHVSLFDVGGGARIRAIWKNYYAESYGIVFVVDASDEDRLEECKKILHETEMQPRVAGKPLLILGNKQDCDGALNENDLQRRLELDTLVDRYKCPCEVFCCTAVLGKGNKVDRQIKKGFRWLLSEISSDYADLSRRVEKDIAEQKRAQEEERELKRERVRLAKEAREKAEKEAAERAKLQAAEESDDGVVVGKDKKNKQGRGTPEHPTSPRKKKKEKEKEATPEPETSEKKTKKKKKKKKLKNEEDDDAQENTRNEDETPRSFSPIETNSRGELDKSTDNLHQEQGKDVDGFVSPRSENATTPDEGEVKKTRKKKKKRTRQNKTAPLEEEQNYELPPLKAWDSPPSTLNGTLNGFPASGGVSPRRLEPLGPPRLPGSRGFTSPSIPEGDEESNSLPPLRGMSWTRIKPNSEDNDLVT